MAIYQRPSPAAPIITSGVGLRACSLKVEDFKDKNMRQKLNIRAWFVIPSKTAML
jgi:hypothetical protein